MNNPKTLRRRKVTHQAKALGVGSAIAALIGYGLEKYGGIPLPSHIAIELGVVCMWIQARYFPEPKE